MDLREITEFIKNENENYDDRNGDEQYDYISNKVDLSPQYRLRAYTWHGDRPSLHGNLHSTTTANATDATILEDSAENDGIKKFEKASDVEQTSASTGTRKNFTRRNAWGNWSYADIITKAINSTPNKRMTLSEIYNWMMQNIPFFKEKGETNSSAGWKNSIRHNLSLHSCFMKVQNESTGKSSWWMLNPDYKCSKLPRRRAATMDVSKLSALQSQRKMKKIESMDNVVDDDYISKNNRSKETLLNSFSSVPNDNFNDCINAMDDFINSLKRSSAQNVKMEAFNDSDEKPLPPAPAPSLSSSFTDQPFQWPLSQIFDHNFSPNDFYKGRETEDFFKLLSTEMMESDSCSVRIPTINTKMTVIKTENAAYSNSLPLLSNMNNLIPGTNFFYDNGKGKETDNETFLMNNDQLFNNSINDIKSNENYLLSGGRLVRSSSSLLKPQNNLNNYNYQSEDLIDGSDQNISKQNPLLSEYLSQDDSAINNNFDFCQNLSSGITLNSKNSVNMASPVRPVSWQEQEQFKSNHGLLLQLLTEKSQNKLQFQFIENSDNKLILPRLLCDDNRKHNCALHQQSDNFNVNHRHHHHQNQLTPQNSSMLRHLLTAGQKCHRSSNVNNPNHLHRSIPSAHRTANQPFNRLPFPVAKLPENNADSRHQHSHLVSSHINTPEMFPVQKAPQQHAPNTAPFVNNVNNYSQQEANVNSNINVLSSNREVQQLGPSTDSVIPTASELLPSDLDLSLLDLDIECNIDQVIDHEKKFGDDLDFSFDDDFMLIDGAF